MQTSRAEKTSRAGQSRGDQQGRAEEWSSEDTESRAARDKERSREQHRKGPVAAPATRALRAATARGPLRQSRAGAPAPATLWAVEASGCHGRASHRCVPSLLVGHHARCGQSRGRGGAVRRHGPAAASSPPGLSVPASPPEPVARACVAAWSRLAGHVRPEARRLQRPLRSGVRPEGPHEEGPRQCRRGGTGTRAEGALFRIHGPKKHGPKKHGPKKHGPKRERQRRMSPGPCLPGRAAAAAASP
jgi:hypothetical protein